MQILNRSSRYLITFLLLCSAVPSSTRMLTLKNPKNERWSLKGSFIKELVELFNIRGFVETGTLIGDSAYEAAQHCKEVHTIELQEKLYHKATERFKDMSSVHLYLGDSSAVLQQLVPQLSESCLFWLDGHYSEGTTAKGNSVSPILEELQIIKQTGLQDAVILIDDIRLFGSMTKKFHNPAYEFPTLRELMAAIDSLTEHTFIVYGDIGIIYPRTSTIAVSPVIQACTASKFFDETRMSVQEIMDIEENIIAYAQDEEREYLQSLAPIFKGVEVTCHEFPLWRGLVLYNDKEYKEACAEFLTCIALGNAHWRVYWYLAKAAHKARNNTLAAWALEGVLKCAKNFEDAKLLYEKIKK
jgi:tetratricopeptide (TPR) repeat protein